MELSNKNFVKKTTDFMDFLSYLNSWESSNIFDPHLTPINLLKL